MSGPNRELMEAYGNEDVYLRKQAGLVDTFLGSLLGGVPQVAGGYFAHQRAKRDMAMMEHAHRESLIANELLAQAEAERLQAASSAIRYTRAPVMVAPWMPHSSLQGGKMQADDIGYPELPVGMDAGMVRLASVAGRTMATKEATAKFGGLARGAAIGLAGVGTVAVAGKGLGKLNKFMNSEPEHATFNQGGYQVPPSVNQHGYTSF